MKQIALAFLLLSTTLITTAQTAEEIVANHIAAIGGVDAWRKVNSIKMEGQMKLQGADVSVAMTTAHLKGNRQDISLMGMTGYRIVTPSTGWNFMPFQGQTAVEAMTEEALKEAQDDMDAQGKLIDYKEKGTTIELIGKDDVEGTECFKLVAITKNGVKETMYIEPSTYYIIKSVIVSKANGQEVETASSFSNYTKQPEGIVIPLSIMLPFGELNVTKVEVNNPVDEQIFQPTK